MKKMNGFILEETVDCMWFDLRSMAEVRRACTRWLRTRGLTDEDRIRFRNYAFGGKLRKKKWGVAP